MPKVLIIEVLLNYYGNALIRLFIITFYFILSVEWIDEKIVRLTYYDITYNYIFSVWLPIIINLIPLLSI